MRFTLRIIIFLYLCTIIGCSSDSGSGVDNTPVIVNYDTSVTNVVLSSQSVMISEQQTLDALNAGGISDNSLTFAGLDSAASSLVKDNIIAIQPSEKSPNGLLRKVVSVDTSSGDTIVATEPAALTEYLNEATIDISGIISPGGYVESQTVTGIVFGKNTPKLKDALPGVTLVTNHNMATGVATTGGGCPVSGSVSHSIAIDNVELEPGLTLDGCVSFELDFSIKGDIKIGKLEYFKLEVKNTQRADLKLTSTLIDSNYKKEHVITSINLGAIIAGPVVITPEIDVVIGVDGNLNVSISISGASETSTTTGVQYENSQWSPISQLNSDFDFTNPTLNASASASAYAGIEANFLLYSVVGAGVTSHGYIQISADIIEDPWWYLYGGFRAGIQAVGEVWDVTLFEYSVPDLIEYKKILASSEDVIMDDVLANNITSGSISFSGGITPENAYIRLVPLEFQQDDGIDGFNYGSGLRCKIQADGTWGDNNCVIVSEDKKAYFTESEQYQVLVFLDANGDSQFNPEEQTMCFLGQLAAWESWLSFTCADDTTPISVDGKSSYSAIPILMNTETPIYQSYDSSQTAENTNSIWFKFIPNETAEYNITRTLENFSNTDEIPSSAVHIAIEYESGSSEFWSECINGADMEVQSCALTLEKDTIYLLDVRSYDNERPTFTLNIVK